MPYWIAITLTVLALLNIAVKRVRLPYISSRQHPRELKGARNFSRLLTMVYFGLLMMFFVVFGRLSGSVRIVLLLWLLVSLMDQGIEFLHYRAAIRYRVWLLQKEKQDHPRRSSQRQ